MSPRIERKIACFFLLLVLNALTAKGGEIQLLKEHRTSGSVVRLGEIATFADAADAAELQQVALFPAPKAGFKRHVSAQDVRETLAVLGYANSAMTVVGAVTIQGEKAREAETLITPAANILEAPATTIPVPSTVKTAELRDSTADIDQALALVSGYVESKDRSDATWSVVPQFTAEQAKQVATMQQPEISGGSAPFTGRQFFSVRDSAHPLAKAVFLKVDVNRTDRAVVARRRLQPGDVITIDDVELREVSSLVNSIQAVRAEEAAVGMEVTRVIPEGQVLQTAQLRRRVMVKKGDIVNVYSVAAGIYVKSSARALADGALGDVMLFQALEGTNKIQARVTAPQEAMVFVDSPRVTNQASRSKIEGQPAFQWEAAATSGKR